MLRAAPLSPPEAQWSCCLSLSATSVEQPQSRAYGLTPNRAKAPKSTESSHASPSTGPQLPSLPAGLVENRPEFGGGREHGRSRMWLVSNLATTLRSKQHPRPQGRGASTRILRRTVINRGRPAELAPHVDESARTRLHAGEIGQRNKLPQVGRLRPNGVESRQCLSTVDIAPKVGRALAQDGSRHRANSHAHAQGRRGSQPRGSRTTTRNRRGHHLQPLDIAGTAGPPRNLRCSCCSYCPRRLAAPATQARAWRAEAARGLELDATSIIQDRSDPGLSVDLLVNAQCGLKAWSQPGRFQTTPGRFRANLKPMRPEHRVGLGPL